MKKLLILFISALFCAGLLFPAQGAFAQRKPSTQELIKFEALGGKMEYLGKQYGLDAWLLVERDGKPRSMLYVLEDGTMVRGTLFNAAGMNVTKSQMEVYAARTSGSQKSLDVENTDRNVLPKSEVFYAELEKANWVRIGKVDAPYLYMIINVNCTHCQELFRTLKGSVDKGMLQLRVLPTGAETENLNGGQAFLSVEDPEKSWSDYMDGNKGALSQSLIKGDALQKLQENNKLASKWKLPEMPITVYRKLADGVVTVIVGPPKNTMVIPADLIKNE